MNQSTPRVAALVAAPLLVVASTALVLLPRGGDGPPPPSPDGPVVVVRTPADRAILELGPVVVRAGVSDPDGISAAELRVGDDEVASTITSGGAEADVRFDWEPDEPGDYTLIVRAVDVLGSWGQSAVTVSVGTGEPPLPPPPTTSPQTTVALTTTSSVAPTTEAATTTTPAATSTSRPTVPSSPPTNPPTAPPTVPTTLPPTLPPTTLPPTTLPPETTTTTTTVVPTTTATTVTSNAGPGRGCRGGDAVLFAPFNGSSGVSPQPTFAWGYFGACTPVSQVLRLAYAGGGGEIPLSGAARSYTSGAPLPACTDVRWSILSVGTDGRTRDSRSARFTTTGC